MWAVSCGLSHGDQSDGHCLYPGGNKRMKHTLFEAHHRIFQLVHTSYCYIHVSIQQTVQLGMWLNRSSQWKDDVSANGCCSTRRSPGKGTEYPVVSMVTGGYYMPNAPTPLFSCILRFPAHGRLIRTLR